MRAPFPWFGGKSRVADLIWSRLGDVPNYVEPFFGSGAVLLSRPGFDQRGDTWTETVNDKDGFVANFWRATTHDPDAVAEAADWPVNENDLHARHLWLVERVVDLTARIEGDPGYYDAKIAGWWVWGICSWIGDGWCSDAGPWHVVDGRLVKDGNAVRGVNRKRPHLNAGRGVNRKLPHLGDAGRGVNRQRQPLLEMFRELSTRLRRVRICSGDWSRVCGPSPTFKNGLTGVFLDPPYSGETGRDNNLYRCEDISVAHDVREWCVTNGDNPLLRIALCGYEGEHNALEKLGWSVVEWKATGGYGSRSSGVALKNSSRERVWFSPHCQDDRQGRLL